MPTNISWSLNVKVQSGPQIVETNSIQVDAFDKIDIAVPDTTASPKATEIDVQPGAAGKIKFLLIRSTAYGDKLEYKVHDATTDKRFLNDVLLLTGKGGLDLLEDTGKPLDKLLVTNTTGAGVVLEIFVGRSAV